MLCGFHSRYAFKRCQHFRSVNLSTEASLNETHVFIFSYHNLKQLCIVFQISFQLNPNFGNTNLQDGNSAWTNHKNSLHLRMEVVYLISMLNHQKFHFCC